MPIKFRHFSLPSLVLGFGLSMLSLPSMAQYTGPSAAQADSVGEVLERPVDDQFITLRGYIVQRLSHEKYLFSDGKHQIRVEIDQQYLPTQPVNEKTLVEISGEVEKDFLESPEIDVKSVKILNGG